METLLERAERVLGAHPAPALPLNELRRLVRGSGVAVAEDTLLRALAQGAGRFRIVDPWRGPWSPLCPYGPANRRRARRSAAGPGAGPGRRPRAAGLPGRRANPSMRGPGRRSADDGARPAMPGVGVPLVVARPRPCSDGRDGPPLRLLRRCVAHLGWTLDDASPGDMARWCGMLHETAELRHRLRATAA